MAMTNGGSFSGHGEYVLTRSARGSHRDGAVLPRHPGAGIHATAAITVATRSASSRGISLAGTGLLNR